MYPDQPQPTPPSQIPPSDYLNQISAKPPKAPGFKPSLKGMIIIAAALVALVIIVALTVNIVVASQRQPLQQLAARLATTQTIADDAQSNLKTSQLRSLNSNLKIYLTNTNRDIGEPLLANGVNVAKLPDSIVTKESPDAVAATLENARLNARFDTTYAREMAYELDITLSLMRQILASTNSASLKAFLEPAITNLEPTQQSFADFSVAD